MYDPESFSLPNNRRETLPGRGKTRKRSPFVYGVIAILLLVGGLTTFSPNGWLGVSAIYATPVGAKQMITLGEGSALELNTGSAVRIHFNRWRRSVELLHGEVFFTIAHNDKRPFEVHAGNGLIRDIGTAFEVYKQPSRVLVAVQEGSVEVDTGHGKRSLHAGEQITYDDAGLLSATQNADISTLTAWRHDRLIFKKQRLGDVLAEITRYHDVDLRLQDQSLAELTVSGEFRTKRLDEILGDITTILPVSVKRINSREIVLEPAMPGTAKRE